MQDVLIVSHKGFWPEDITTEIERLLFLWDTLYYFMPSPYVNQDESLKPIYIQFIDNLSEEPGATGICQS